MRVATVSQPAVRSSGTGQYTDQLVGALPDVVAVERVTLPVDTANPLPFVRGALDERLTAADVVHVQFDYVVFGPAGLFVLLFFPIVALRARRAGVPLVVTPHEALGPTEAVAPLAALKRWYLWLINWTVARTATELVFLSRATRDRFLGSVHVAADRVTLLSHGVPEPQYDGSRGAARERLGIDQETHLLVAPGYVSPRKGSDVFLEAATHLPEVTFLLAGGPPRPAHRVFADDLSATAPPNCTVTGRLSEEAFHAAFVAADLVVLPYRETEQRGVINPVGQSGVFNWAAAYGVPVLASDCPHFRALADRWAVRALFAAGHPQALAAAAERLLDDEPRRRSLADAMTAYREANSLESVARDHQELYRSVVEG